MSEDTRDAEGISRTKVGRLMEEYDFPQDFGDRLEAYWTGEGAERRSLRDLADLFNRWLLETAMEESGISSVDGEIENLYTLLTDDDVSSGVRIEAENRLERDGLDVEQLEEDFVTYQAVRSYLQRRGAEYEHPTDEEQLEKDRERIRRLRTKISSVSSDRLAKLSDTGRLDLDEFRVFVDVSVLCENCLSQHSIEDVFEHGGCTCSGSG